MRPSRRIVLALAGTTLAGAALGPGLTIRADGPAVVAFAIDTSGSLQVADLARAAELASGLLANLPAGTEAALFTFDDQARVVVPRTADPATLAQALAGLHRQGRRTAMNDALYDAARYLRDGSDGRRALVLITDGHDEDSAVELADGLAVAQQSAIPVFTVGVGRVEERVLRRVAKLTGGEYAALRAARPETIASRIAGGAATPAPATKGERAAVTPASPSPGAEPAPARGSRTWAWVVAGIALLAALAVLFRGGRGRREAGDRALEAAAPTLLERMSTTEEYLEKTVTLRENPVLTVTRGPGTGQVFDLRPQAATSIGRAKANEVVIDDVSVSSEHCRIRPEDGHFVLHDLKSTNGTFVNERRVARHVLAEGDVLKIGETSLLFRTDLKRT
jgi:hypothetical protein